MFNGGGDDDYVPESWEDEIDDFAESFILTGKGVVMIVHLYHGVVEESRGEAK